jgi:cystathionine beta-lyase
MEKIDNLGFGTKAIHAGQSPDPATGAIMTPIYQTSTYVQEAPGVHKGFEYARTQNPTRLALEKNLAALENARFGYCFGSGMAAVDAIIKLLSPGDEVISTFDLYGGTYRAFVRVFANFGIKFHFVDMGNPNNVQELINDKTKMIWLETPTNPTLRVIDIEAIANLAKGKNIWVVADNTFATPYLQTPITLGADIVMHSATKYLGGHSDVVLGAVITDNEEIAAKIAFIQNTTGGVCGPHDAWLVLRGTKTLHIRMQRHSENGQAVAEFLQNHPKVDRVFYPGLPNHPGHEIAKKQMSSFSGMMSFSLKGDKYEDALKVLTHTHVFALAESLGGVESLIGHPASMTHAAIPKEEREKSGVVDSLIRLSVGIEDIEDLIADLSQALDQV